MSIDNRNPSSEQIPSPTSTLLENNKTNTHEHANFLQHLHIKPRHHYHPPYSFKSSSKTKSRNASLPAPVVHQALPTNLLELQQQRSTEANTRKERIITRIVSAVGFIIIFLCAVIVTFTLKMAPKIDELVRTKTSQYNRFYAMSRLSTSETTPTEFSNFTGYE